ncbi:MAG: hypothetical protein ACHQ7M_23480, partial [Chloroflexota bacterium]
MSQVSQQVLPPAADMPDPTATGRRPLRWYFQGWRLYVGLLILLVLFPQLVGNNGAFTGLLFSPTESLVTTGVRVGISVILALGLNLDVGYAGLLDLGYVAFFALGAYFCGALTQGFLIGSDGQSHVTPT